MTDNIIPYIQTIAKTKIIEDKADRALRSIEETQKSTIEGQTVKAVQSAAGYSAAQTSSQGGTNALIQASQSAAELGAITSALSSLGYSDNQIAKYALQYLQDNYGVDGTYDVAGVLDGKIGPAPNWTAFPGGQDYSTNDNINDRVEGVIGLDVSDLSKAIVVNFIDKGYLPSSADSINAGQEPWTDITNPPEKLGFQFGYYWSYAGFNAATPTDALEQGIAGGAFPNATHGGASVTGTSGGQPNQYTYSVEFEPGLPTDVNVIRGGSGSDCSGAFGSTICPATAPHEISWPVVGTYILNLVDGLFVGSPFNAELPDKLRYNNTSSIQLANASDGRIIDILPGVNGGTVIIDSTRTETGLFYDSNGYLRAFVPVDRIQFFVPK